MTRLRPLLTLATGLVLLYLSRFWPPGLWSPNGLLGWTALPPQGNLLATWLRNTPAAPFDLLIWAILAFLTLTALQRLLDRLG